MKPKIKKAAINLFYKKGYFATSMSAIAKATGIRKSSIYHHYATKEEILLDIFRTTMEDLQGTLQERLEPAVGAEERIRVVICCHINFHIQRQKEAIIADSELRGLSAGNYNEIVAMRDHYERVVQNVIEDGVAEGVFAETDTKVISFAILSMCTGVCSWFKKAGRLSKASIADSYADFILKGLART